MNYRHPDISESVDHPLRRERKGLSKGAAHFLGVIVGPGGALAANGNGSLTINPDSQEIGHTHLGREVFDRNGARVGYFLDTQYPVNTTPEN